MNIADDESVYARCLRNMIVMDKEKEMIGHELRLKDFGGKLSVEDSLKTIAEDVMKVFEGNIKKREAEEFVGEKLEETWEVISVKAKELSGKMKEYEEEEEQKKTHRTGRESPKKKDKTQPRYKELAEIADDNLQEDKILYKLPK